jgi:hypothetical protein
LLRKICVYFVFRSSNVFCLSILRLFKFRSPSKEAHLSNVACYNLRDFPFFAAAAYSSRPLYWNGKYLHHEDESNGYFNNKVSRSCTHKLLLQSKGHVPKERGRETILSPFPFLVSLQAERRKIVKCIYVISFSSLFFFVFLFTNIAHVYITNSPSPTDNYVYILPFFRGRERKNNGSDCAQSFSVKVWRLCCDGGKRREKN